MRVMTLDEMTAFIESEPGSVQRGRRPFYEYEHFRCDKCGRFVRPNGPGVSSSQSYQQTWEGPDLLDPTYRCSPCTDAHGIEPSNCHPPGSYAYRNPTTPDAK